MRIKKKLLSILLCFLLVFVPFAVKAEELSLKGQVTSLKNGQKAPYAGILLDSVAASKMIVDKKYLQKIHVETIKLRDQQIDTLDKALKVEMGKSDNSQWWLAGGVVVGILLSVAVFYASVEVVNKNE
jgi:hypothetical protein